MFDGWAFTVVCALVVFLVALLLCCGVVVGQEAVSDEMTHQLLSQTNSVLEGLDQNLTFTSSVLSELQATLNRLEDLFMVGGILLLFSVGVLTFFGMK